MKLLLSKFLVFFWFLSFSQVLETDIKPFSKNSFALSFGNNLPIRPFQNGYYAHSDSYIGAWAVNHYELTYRRMFNNKFGIHFDLGYSDITNARVSNSFPFNTNLYFLRTGLTLNLARVLEFEKFTNNFGLLLNTGIFVGVFGGDRKEDNGGFYLGLQPQYRLSNRFALHANLTLNQSIRQNFNWDGSLARNTSLEGYHITTTLGVTIYTDSKRKHADWYVPMSVEDKNKLDIELFEERISQLENMLKDTDNDGVPDHIDVEPNTPKGAFVNTKGQTIDITAMVAPSSKNVVDFESSPQQLVTNIIDNERHILFFNFNNVTLIEQSQINLAYIIELVKKYPHVKIEITGYTDPIGNDLVNQRLSLRRAQRVKQMLVRSQINPENITTVGAGVYPHVNEASNYSYPFARRVEFKFIIE